MLQPPRANFHWPRRLYNATISQAPPSCTSSHGFCRPASITDTGTGQAEGLGVSQGWSLVPVLTLDPSLADKSRNFLSFSPHLCHQADDVKGREESIGKHFRWCNFALSLFKQVWGHPHPLQRAGTKSLPPLILTYIPPWVFCFFTSFWHLLLFPHLLAQEVGRMSWFHKNLVRHSASKCNIFFFSTSELQIFWEALVRGSLYWRFFFRKSWACRCQMTATAVHP